MNDRHEVKVLRRQAITERTVRLTLGGPTLVGLTPRPAQDVEILTGGDGQRPLKRRYTIRHGRPQEGEWDIDVVVHGTGGPGSRWAAHARAGEPVELIGPRGKLELRSADRHLFVGDEAALPAIAALSEALPTAERSKAIVQVGSVADELPVAADDIRWLHRNGRPADTVDLLIPAVDDAVASAGFGQVYVLTEAHAARAIRELLVRHGLDGDRVFAKGYWTSRPAGGEASR